MRDPRDREIAALRAQLDRERERNRSRSPLRSRTDEYDCYDRPYDRSYDRPRDRFNDFDRYRDYDRRAPREFYDPYDRAADRSRSRRLSPITHGPRRDDRVLYRPTDGRGYFRDAYDYQGPSAYMFSKDSDINISEDCLKFAELKDLVIRFEEILDFGFITSQEKPILKEVTPPEIDKSLLQVCLGGHAVWDPGATSDMASTSALRRLDLELRARSGGKLAMRWFTSSAPRAFRVANGKLVNSSYEVVLRIPLGGSHDSLIFRASAINAGPDPSAQVPYLFSNSSGKILGAVVSSRTGIMYTEEPKLSGWKCKMTEGRSGHWLFPLVNVALDFARIQY